MKLELTSINNYNNSSLALQDTQILSTDKFLNIQRKCLNKIKNMNPENANLNQTIDVTELTSQQRGRKLSTKAKSIIRVTATTIALTALFVGLLINHTNAYKINDNKTITYTVQQGDTLNSIASKYQYKFTHKKIDYRDYANEILNVNDNIHNGDVLAEGMNIKLPVIEK